MTREASVEVLARTHLGRLACVNASQPYIIPIYFAYQDSRIYSFSMPGQKITWMRANPLVCIEVDEMRRERWATVVVSGRYTELTDTAGMQRERALAYQLLRQQPQWWEPGSVKIALDIMKPALAPVFYRIEIVQITGRCGILDPARRDNARKRAGKRRSWLHEWLQRGQLR